MTRSPMRTALALTAVVLALSPAAALADTRDRIIKDCADDGQLQGSYSQSDLRDARQNMPSDVAEYTDCADVLRRAELPDGSSGSDAAAGAAGAAGLAGGTGALLTPVDDREREVLARAVSSGSQPVEIDGESIVPGAAGLIPDAKRNGLPGSLIGVLALLLAGAGAALYPAARRGDLTRLLRRS